MDKGIRINLWTNPYISPDSKLYKDIYPVSGSHTVWNGIVPDLANDKAKRLFQDKLIQEHIGIGQMRLTYGVLAQRTTNELFRKYNKRTYGLVRASNAGANSFPYVLYNDYYNHSDFITALINSGYCGMLWTPEVRSSRSAEEWLRRFQTVVFSPMAMIDSWNSDTKPWTFPEVAGQVKEYALLRIQMMPYWYTEFARYHFDGIPPFRGMSLEPGFTLDGVITSELQEKPVSRGGDQRDKRPVYGR